jgi:phosphoenolpyruvate phosphomutase
VLSDEAISSFKRYPLIPFEERKALFENMAGVERVVEQKTLSYKENLEALKPDFLVHGNDWCEGFQKPIRQEVNISHVG